MKDATLDDAIATHARVAAASRAKSLLEFVRAALEREIGRDAKSDLDVIREFTHTQRSVEIGVGERAFMPSARTNRFVDTYSFTRSIQRSRRKGRWPADLLARVMASGARCKRAKPQ